MQRIKRYEDFMSEDNTPSLLPVVRWASRKYPASELQPQTFNWGGFESKALCFTPFDGMEDPRINLWHNLLKNHHNKDLVKNFYYLDLSDFPLKNEKQLTEFAELTYKSLKAERMMKEDYKIHMTLSKEFGKPQIIEIRLLEGCKIKVLDYLEVGIKKVAEKFATINKYIESGQEIPKELSKNFVSFPLSDDPYKGIDDDVNELKSFNKREGDDRWAVWGNGKLFLNPTNQDRMDLGFGDSVGMQLDHDKKEIKISPFDDWADTKIILNVQKAIKDMLKAKVIDDTWNCIIMRDKLMKRSIGSTKVKEIIKYDFSFTKVIPFAYHGTSDYFLDKIKKNGLQPRDQSGEDEIWDKGYTNDSSGNIYMTIDYNRANYYADYTVDALREKYGIESKPIVIQVRNLPTSMVTTDDDLLTNMGMLQLLALLRSGKTKEDFASRASYITGIRQSGQFAVKGRIPASMISKIYKEKPTSI